ncbi:MAG: tetratricopeptide repeat protein, partial [Acidobacteriota bacterium]
HPDLAESLNNMGTSLIELGRLEEAREVLERALEERRAIFGEGANDLVASTTFNLARVNEAPEIKKRLLEEALTGFEKSIGPEHPSVAFPLFELGKLELEVKRHEAALAFFDRAHDVRRANLPDDHRLLVLVRLGICQVLADLGRVDDSRGLDCREIQEAPGPS